MENKILTGDAKKEKMQQNEIDCINFSGWNYVRVADSSVCNSLRISKKQSGFPYRNSGWILQEDNSKTPLEFLY